MSVYLYPQETWDEKKCERMARKSTPDAYGNKPPKGIIARSASTYPEYGQSQRFNGGTVIKDEWYESVSVPLPKIHEDYEFYNLFSWGTVIRKKNQMKKLKQKLTEKQYIDKCASKCPFCEGEEIEAGHFEGDGMIAWVDILCKSCESVWQDIYTLTGIDTKIK